MQPRILVIRGGAIGDFLLTLPAIALLREAFPAAHLEILGYEHIVALATRGGYANAARSIEYGPLANFFNPKATALDEELSEYFGGFQQIVSYLYDPDGFFAGNLRRCGVKNLVEASSKIDPEGDHAARQLARPLEKLALYLDAAGVHLRPGAMEEKFAENFLPAATPDRPLVALHPGSGGERKNWPVERWLELAEFLLTQAWPEGRPRLLVVGGEADAKVLAAFQRRWPVGRGREDDVLYAENLPLTQVCALLARCRFFVGHDSGISHLAAAAGIEGVVLFGPTDPDLWAPPYPGVRVVRAADGLMTGIALEEVRAAVAVRVTRRS